MQQHIALYSNGKRTGKQAKEENTAYHHSDKPRVRHLLQKATNRVAELEHLIGKYQEKLDSLSEDKTMIIKERVEWERKYYERDKQNYALLDTLKKQGELLEKAKTELRHCKGFFSSANEDVLKELGIS